MADGHRFENERVHDAAYVLHVEELARHCVALEGPLDVVAVLVVSVVHVLDALPSGIRFASKESILLPSLNPGAAKAGQNSKILAGPGYVYSQAA